MLLEIPGTSEAYVDIADSQKTYESKSRPEVAEVQAKPQNSYCIGPTYNMTRVHASIGSHEIALHATLLAIGMPDAWFVSSSKAQDPKCYIQITYRNDTNPHSIPVLVMSRMSYTLKQEIKKSMPVISRRNKFLFVTRATENWPTMVFQSHQALLNKLWDWTMPVQSVKEREQRFLLILTPYGEFLCWTLCPLLNFTVARISKKWPQGASQSFLSPNTKAVEEEDWPGIPQHRDNDHPNDCDGPNRLPLSEGHKMDLQELVIPPQQKTPSRLQYICLQTCIKRLSQCKIFGTDK